MNDKLGNMLHDWAAKRASAEEHLRELADRIRTEAAREKCKKTSLVIIPFWSKFGYACLGAVVTLIVSLFYIHSLAPVRLPSSGNGSAANLAVISGKQIETERRLFGEMKRLFSDRLRWISESNGDMGIGVESLPGGSPEDSLPMLVRLMVVSRKSGESTWRPVWNTDVLLHGEEIVEVVSNRESDNRLTLWVYPLADGKVAVDTSLSLEMPVRLSSRMNMVVQPGQPCEIVSLRSADTEYRVFQTVTALGMGV